MKVTLSELQKYLEYRKEQLGIDVDGDDYRNKGENRTLEKIELLKRIEERKRIRG